MKSFTTFSVLSASVVFIFSYTLSCSANTTLSVEVLTEIYEGEFNDISSFRCTNAVEPFTLEGSWDNNILNGDALITYDNGEILKATYTDGLMENTVYDYKTDGTYTTFQVKDGFPYGLITFYDSDNKITDTDHYFQTESISYLMEISEPADYHVLLTLNSAQINPITITGTVMRIYDEADKEYLIVRDNNNYFYVLWFYNTAADKQPLNQAIVPNLKEGDSITAYGYFQKNDTFTPLADSVLIDDWKEHHPSSGSVISDIDNTKETEPVEKKEKNENDTQGTPLLDSFPYVMLISAECKDDEPIDTMELSSYTYTDLLRNPYWYNGQTCSLDGTIIKLYVDYSKHMVSALFDDTDQNSYYLEFALSDEIPVPATGDAVHIEGTLNGNYKDEKEYSSEGEPTLYIIYPKIVVGSVVLK